MKHIDSKTEFYKLSKQLLLGNRVEQWTWDVFKERYEQEYESLPKLIGVRHLGVAGKGTSRLMRRNAAYAYGKLNGSSALYDSAAPPEFTTIQGEVQPTERGLYLRYSKLKCHQRMLWEIDRGVEDNAHKLPKELWLQVPFNWPPVKHTFGLTSSSILQKYMDDNSWLTLNDIFREYHYPVVEFSCYDRPMGILGWNTLFWEVRTRY